MNHQEIFDKVVTHARKQNAKAILGVGVLDCRYRMDDGKQCFFGCLIPDNLYDPKMEGKGIRREMGDNNLILFGKVLDFLEVDRESDDIRFLSRLQGIHDHCEPEKWEERFQDVAKEFALEYSPVVPEKVIDSEG